MKTVLQELIEKWDSSGRCLAMVKDAKSKLPQEKEMIMKAYKDGCNDGVDSFENYDKECKLPEQYYKDNYQ